MPAASEGQSRESEPGSAALKPVSLAPRTLPLSIAGGGGPAARGLSRGPFSCLASVPLGPHEAMPPTHGPQGAHGGGAARLPPAGGLALGFLEGDPGAGPPGTCPCSGPPSSRSPALGTDRCPRRGGACVRCVGAGEGPDRAAGWRRGTRAAHFVFLLLELLLQVELLCLQVVDALPELLGLLPARATAGVWGTAGSKDGPSASIPILTQPPGAPALLPACPPAEGPPSPGRALLSTGPRWQCPVHRTRCLGLPGQGSGDTEDREEACSPAEHLGRPHSHTCVQGPR